MNNKILNYWFKAIIRTASATIKDHAKFWYHFTVFMKYKYAIVIKSSVIIQNQFFNEEIYS